MEAGGVRKRRIIYIEVVRSAFAASDETESQPI